MTKSVRYIIALCAAAFSAAFTGCAASLPLAAAKHGAMARTAPGLQSNVTLIAATSVQAMPEYKAATKLCSSGKYKQAAQILNKMQQSQALSTEQRLFCERQEIICLGHLGPTAAKARTNNRISNNQIAPAHTVPKASAESVDCGPRALLIACDRLGVKATLPDLIRSAATEIGRAHV